MIIRINVSIEGTPNGREGYGNMQFNESTTINDSSFETVSKVFTKCHELLAVITNDHKHGEK
jgi:hypothetical protein